MIVGNMAIGEGSEDMVERRLRTRFILDPDGYGTPVFADPGDYVVVSGVVNPPDTTERGVSCFEPTKLLYVGPNQQIAYLVARDVLARYTDTAEQRANNQPIDTCYVYHVYEANPGYPDDNFIRTSHSPPWQVFSHYPESYSRYDTECHIAFLVKCLSQSDGPATRGMVRSQKTAKRCPSMRTKHIVSIQVSRHSTILGQQRIIIEHNRGSNGVFSRYVTSPSYTNLVNCLCRASLGTMDIDFLSEESTGWIATFTKPAPVLCTINECCCRCLYQVRVMDIDSDQPIYDGHGCTIMLGVENEVYVGLHYTHGPGFCQEYTEKEVEEGDD